MRHHLYPDLKFSKVIESEPANSPWYQTQTTIEMDGDCSRSHFRLYVAHLPLDDEDEALTYAKIAASFPASSIGKRVIGPNGIIFDRPARLP